MISVLMCVRDERPEILARSLASLQAQTLSEFEILLVDDGSTSLDTIAELERWERAESRLRLLKEPHRGLTAALNVGLRHCRGDLIARQDADDWSAPQRLEQQVRLLTANATLGLLGTQIDLHMENGVRLWSSRFPTEHNQIALAFPRCNPFCHGSTMYRRQLALQLGGYREILRTSQDYDLFWRMSEVANVGNVAAVLYHHRRRAASITARRATDQMYATLLIRTLAKMRHEGHEDISTAESQAREALQSLDLEMWAARKHADQLMLSGSWKEALREFVNLVRRYKLDVASYALFLRFVLFLLAPPFRGALFRR